MANKDMTPTNQNACELIPAGNTANVPGSFSDIQAAVAKSKKKRWKAAATTFPNFQSGFFTSDGKRYIDADQSWGYNN